MNAIVEEGVEIAPSDQDAKLFTHIEFWQLDKLDEALRAGGNVDATRKLKHGPVESLLDDAVRTNKHDTVSLLLEHGACRDPELLARALRVGIEEINFFPEGKETAITPVEKLLLAVGANPKLEDAAGNNAIFLADKKGRTALANYMRAISKNPAKRPTLADLAKEGVTFDLEKRQKALGETTTGEKEWEDRQAPLNNDMLYDVAYQGVARKGINKIDL